MKFCLFEFSLKCAFWCGFHILFVRLRYSSVALKIPLRDTSIMLGSFWNFLLVKFLAADGHVTSWKKFYSRQKHLRWCCRFLLRQSCFKNHVQRKLIQRSIPVQLIGAVQKLHWLASIVIDSRGFACKLKNGREGRGQEADLSLMSSFTAPIIHRRDLCKCDFSHLLCLECL